VVDEELELIRRVRMGDMEAYAELLRPLLEVATRLAYGMLQDRCAAEDSVQEAAMRAWQRFGNLEPGRSFRPWFLGIVSNRCREALRGRWWSSVVREADPDAHAAAHDHDWLAGADLRRALAALPHGQRAAIVLHFYLDLPLEEVAATLGLRIAGVKARINRGLRRLREALGPDEVMTT
jgi:RNA polymerase sigma-70 factor (ECF subfamily)